ncbi:MAG TPA: hypothetical protein VK826_19575 [Bacteroidia bacterium]|nr:hypothetical protein [Bacteroidia bacterium]
MKHSLFLLLVCTASLLMGTSAQPVGKLQTTEVYVYICNSEGSVAYHNKTNCKGLQKCTHEVLTVTLADAQGKYSRRACKLCY